jgi:hypothetical protein
MSASSVTGVAGFIASTTASVSIPSNIAEGASRNTTKEFVQFTFHYPLIKALSANSADSAREQLLLSDLTHHHAPMEKFTLDSCSSGLFACLSLVLPRANAMTYVYTYTR